MDVGDRERTSRELTRNVFYFTLALTTENGGTVSASAPFSPTTALDATRANVERSSKPVALSVTTAAAVR